MPIWIGLVLLAQFFNAIVAIIDKFIVTSRKVPRPYLYAFYVSILSSLAVLVFLFSWVPIPIDDIAIPSLARITVPTVSVILLSLIAAYAFFAALLTMFTAFTNSDASDVVPVVGSISALSTFVLSYFFLGTSFTSNFLWGFLFLVVGTFLVSRLRLEISALWLSVAAGFFFALHFVMIKMLFNITDFDNGFLWSRVAIVIAALSTLMLSVNRHKFSHQSKETGKRGGVIWVLGNKTLAGLAAILVLKATELGDVSIVQALGGLQFVFLLSFTAVLGKRTPAEYGENVNNRELFHKFLSVTIITIGFFLLFI